jgi:hypothetical protein
LSVARAVPRELERLEKVSAISEQPRASERSRRFWAVLEWSPGWARATQAGRPRA